MQQPVIHQDPYRIAADRWIIPQIEPTGPGTFASINSIVITGVEPVIVDTGCAVNRACLGDTEALLRTPAAPSVSPTAPTNRPGPHLRP